MIDRRVLIIEDDESQCEGVAKLLRLRGINSDCAGLLEHGLQLARNHRYDAAIVDLNLPDSPPMATLERMTDVHPSRAIAFTGVDDPSIIRECQRRNLVFILKGTSAKGIMAEILKIMEMHEPSEEIERALLDNARQSQNLMPLPWYQRIAPVVGVALALLGASFTTGAFLFNTVSERAAQSQQNKQHFEKLDEAIIQQKIETSRLAESQRDLQIKAQVSIDDRASLHATQDQLRQDIIRRLERIEDKMGAQR